MATTNLNSEDLIARATELLDAGLNRAAIETELNLTENQAYKLITRIKIDKQLTDHPEILDDVRRMLEAGDSKHIIHKETRLPMEAVEYLMAKAWDRITDDELKLEEEPALKILEDRKQKAEQNKRKLQLVARLMAEGLGRIRIQRETGFSKAVVERLMSEIRSESFMTSRVMSKQDKQDRITRITEDGGSVFQVARALEVSPGNAHKLVRKVEGTSVVADDSVRHNIARGTSLFTLISKFGIKDLEQAREVLAEIFPGYLVYEKPLPEGDVGFTVIPDGSGHYDWLNSNTEEKAFKFKVSEKNNYLFVQFNENNLPRLRIYNFTDIHVGHKHFDRERFLSYIEKVKNDPCAFVVLGGDIFEWAHKASVGDPWEQVLSPMEQVSEAARLLMPIAHKILAYRSGNHDKGRGKITGTDLAEVLAHYLKVPYFKVETVIDIVFQGQLFTVSLDHGHSGSAIQSILRDAEKYREYSPFFVHAHFSGHVHNSQIIKRIAKDRVVGEGYVMRRTFTIVGGSCVKFTETYAEEAKYAPTPQDLTFFDAYPDGAYDAGCIPSDPV